MADKMSYGNYPDLKNIKKILVIKLRHLGDLLLTTPVFSFLKKNFPDADIDLYIYDHSFSVVKNNPYINKIYVCNRSIKKKNLFSRYKEELDLLRKIRKENYDLVLNLTEGDRGALAVRASNADVKVGVDPGRSGMLFKKSFYTHIVKNCPNRRHAVEKNLDALRRIGLFPNEENKKLAFFIPDAAFKEIEKILDEKKIEKEKFVLIHPASRWRFKSLSKEKFRNLTKALLKKELKIIFVSGKDPQEIRFVQEIIQGLDVVDMAGRLNVDEFAALLSYSKVLLSVDSFSGHLASCLKKRSVVLFGPTCEVNWGPWKNPLASVITSDHSCRPCSMDGCGGSKFCECLEAISEEKILEKIL